MESARVNGRDNLINYDNGWLTVANRSAAECADARFDGSRFCGVKIIEVHLCERHAACLCGLVGDHRTSVDELLGAPDQGTARAGKKFNVGRPGVPRWRRYVAG